MSPEFDVADHMAGTTLDSPVNHMGNHRLAILSIWIVVTEYQGLACLAA